MQLGTAHQLKLFMNTVVSGALNDDGSIFFWWS